MAEKKEFAWDATQHVGIIPVNEKKRMEVSFNMLEREGEENWYVSVATQEFYHKKVRKVKEGGTWKSVPGDAEAKWHYSKNATFPLDIWHELSDLINSNITTEEE